MLKNRTSPLSKPFDKNEAGFTLIELLVVILVIGILAAVAIPVFLNQRKTANEAAVKSDLNNAAKVFETEFTSNKGKAYPTTMPESVRTSEGVTLSLPEAPTANPSIDMVFRATDGYEKIIKVEHSGPSKVTIHRPELDKPRYLYSYIRVGCPDGTTRRYTVTSINWGPAETAPITLNVPCADPTQTPVPGTILFYLISTSDTSILKPKTATYIPASSPSTTPTSNNKGFCITGTHSNIDGKTFKYDSLNGGFQEGSC